MSDQSSRDAQVKLYQEPPKTRAELRLNYARAVAKIRRQQLQRYREAYQTNDVTLAAVEEAEIAKLQAELHEAICQLDVEEERDA